MKNLIMAAAIAALALASQAATVTWGMTGISDSPDASKAAGWVAYFLDASTYDAFSALSADQVATYAVDKATYTANTQKSARGGDVYVSKASGNYAAGDVISGYIVLFDAANAADAKNYAYTSVGSATINDMGADGSISFGAFSSATSANGGWTAAAVPEPTSGLLMLLGMAGLALKRKRA